jgi:hypothetical protein
MDRSITAHPEPARTIVPLTPAPQRVLCAYSARWLSGPTPRYRGLCPTWDGDEPTADHGVVPTN